jgi:hypothetical protein
MDRRGTSDEAIAAWVVPTASGRAESPVEKKGRAIAADRPLTRQRCDAGDLDGVSTQRAR